MLILPALSWGSRWTLQIFISGLLVQLLFPYIYFFPTSDCCFVVWGHLQSCASKGTLNDWIAAWESWKCGFHHPGACLRPFQWLQILCGLVLLTRQWKHCIMCTGTMETPGNSLLCWHFDFLARKRPEAARRGVEVLAPQCCHYSCVLSCCSHPQLCSLNLCPSSSELSCQGSEMPHNVCHPVVFLLYLS